MRVLNVLAAFLLVVGIAGCASETPAPDATAGAEFTPQAYANLAQLMRGVPFPNSNVIFDTQDLDPETGAGQGADPEAGGGQGATATYGALYGGWEGVENAALAVSEVANLIMIPGRLCENGLPVPLENEDFRRFAQGLADAGQEAYRVAQTRDLDAMLEVGGVISDACLFCHEVYRDKPEGQMRCIP